MFFINSSILLFYIYFLDIFSKTSTENISKLDKSKFPNPIPQNLTNFQKIYGKLMCFNHKECPKNGYCNFNECVCLRGFDRHFVKRKAKSASLPDYLVYCGTKICENNFDCGLVAPNSECSDGKCLCFYGIEKIFSQERCKPKPTSFPDCKPNSYQNSCPPDSRCSEGRCICNLGFVETKKYPFVCNLNVCESDSNCSVIDKGSYCLNKRCICKDTHELDVSRQYCKEKSMVLSTPLAWILLIVVISFLILLCIIIGQIKRRFSLSRMLLKRYG